MCCFHIAPGLLWSSSAGPPPYRSGSWERLLFGPHPLIPTTHLCRWTKLATNPSGPGDGMRGSCSPSSPPPRQREVGRAMSHNCHTKNTAEACYSCQQNIRDARLGCCQALIAQQAREKRTCNEMNEVAVGKTLQECKNIHTYVFSID